jgi:hypothetical protein
MHKRKIRNELITFSPNPDQQTHQLHLNTISGGTLNN